VLFYRLANDQVEMRVVDGRRDLAALFRGD
jgi:hypothetical protein